MADERQTENPREKYTDEALRYSIAIELAGANEEKARALMNPEDEPIIAVKLRFYEENMGIYGLAVIFFSDLDKKIMSILTVINRDKESMNVPVGMPWQDFHAIIERERFKPFDAKLALSFVTVGKEKMTYELRDRFFAYLESPTERKANVLFEDLMYYALGTQNYRVEAAIERLNSIDYHIAEYTEVAQKVKTVMASEAKESIAYENVVVQTRIKMTPIVSPINGTLIFEIREGDIIFVRVDDGSTRGQSYLERMRARYGNENPRIPAVVKSVTRLNAKELEIIVMLEDDLVGVIVETDPLKIMKANANDDTIPVTQVHGAKKAEKPSKKKISSAVIYVAIGAGVLALIATFIILLLSMA